MARVKGGVHAKKKHKAVLLGEDLDPTDVLDGLGDLIEDATPQFGVLHLSTAEHDRDLDLVTLAEELLDLAGLRVEVAGADLGAVLHLLHGDVRGLLAGFLRPLGSLVLVLAVVHDPAHRRVGLVGHLDQVEVLLPGDRQRFGQWADAQLLSVGGDQADLTSPDALVVARLVVGRRRSYRRSLLFKRTSSLSVADADA